MSADNGIYILPSPKDGKIEFRVAHAQAIENIDYDPLYEVLLFKNAPVFQTYKEAIVYADKLAEDYDFLEYGIGVLDERKSPFLHLTEKEAMNQLFPDRANNN